MTNLGIQRQDQNNVPNLSSDIYIESTCQYKSNKHVIKVRADPDQEIWDDSNVHSSWARAVIWDVKDFERWRNL